MKETKPPTAAEAIALFDDLRSRVQADGAQHDRFRDALLVLAQLVEDADATKRPKPDIRPKKSPKPK